MSDNAESGSDGGVAVTFERAKAHDLSWERTGDAEVPWRVEVDGGEWRVRVNDFPAEAMYTLLVDGEPAGDFDDWPDGWERAFR